MTAYFSVSAVLKYPIKRGGLSSCILYTFRFSILASCVFLPLASMPSCARCFLVLKKISLFLEIPELLCGFKES